MSVNVRERYLAAYRHEPVDRVPIALSYFAPGFARRHFTAVAAGEDPIEAGIQSHARYGFDPHGAVRGTGDWFLAHPNAGEETPAYSAASREWHVAEARTTLPSGVLRTDYRVETPSGALTCVRLQTPDDFGTIEAPFIAEEGDIALLRHRPEPRAVVNPGLIRHSVEVMGERCWAMASVAGVWSVASFLRGPERILYDCFDQPAWLKRLLGTLAEHQAELIRAIGAASSGMTLRIDGSFIGFGVSPRLFGEFIQPAEARLVRAGHEAGMLVHLHICGKKNAILEAVADMGIDALETLTPPSAAGDVQLADVKRRIGGRVCLMGGCLSHILAFGAPADVEAEVQRCLREGGTGGGYILSPTGRIDPETPEENLLAFTAAGREHGALPPRGAP